MDGLAIREPTPNVSLLDFTFNTSKEFTIDELNQIIEQSSKQKMKGIVDVNSIPYKCRLQRKLIHAFMTNSIRK